MSKITITEVHGITITTIEHDKNIYEAIVDENSNSVTIHPTPLKGTMLELKYEIANDILEGLGQKRLQRMRFDFNALNTLGVRESGKSLRFNPRRSGKTLESMRKTHNQLKAGRIVAHCGGIESFKQLGMIVDETA